MERLVSITRANNGEYIFDLQPVDKSRYRAEKAKRRKRKMTKASRKGNR